MSLFKAIHIIIENLPDKPFKKLFGSLIEKDLKLINSIILMLDGVA